MSINKRLCLGKYTSNIIYRDDKFSSKEKKIIKIYLYTFSRLASTRDVKGVCESIKGFPYGVG